MLDLFGLPRPSEDVPPQVLFAGAGQRKAEPQHQHHGRTTENRGGQTLTFGAGRLVSPWGFGGSAACSVAYLAGGSGEAERCLAVEPLRLVAAEAEVERGRSAVPHCVEAVGHKPGAGGTAHVGPAWSETPVRGGSSSQHAQLVSRVADWDNAPQTDQVAVVLPIVQGQDPARRDTTVGFRAAADSLASVRSAHHARRQPCTEASNEMGKQLVPSHACTNCEQSAPLTLRCVGR